MGAVPSTMIPSPGLPNAPLVTQARDGMCFGVKNRGHRAFIVLRGRQTHLGTTDGWCTTWLRADLGHPARSGTTPHQCLQFGAKERGRAAHAQTTRDKARNLLAGVMVGDFSTSRIAHCLPWHYEDECKTVGQVRARGVRACAQVAGDTSTGVLRECRHDLWSVWLTQWSYTLPLGWPHT